MEPKHIPAHAVEYLRRYLTLLEDDVQAVLNHRWGLFECPHLTLVETARRMNLSVMEIRQLEIKGRDDLKILFGRQSKWL